MKTMADMYDSPDQGVAVITVFLYEGFRDRYDKSHDRWGRANEEYGKLDAAMGGIEQAELLYEFACAMYEALESIELPEDGWTGVFEYEVINPLGWRIADHIADNGDWPTAEHMVEELADHLPKWLKDHKL